MNEHQMFINLTKRGVINITKKNMNMNGESSFPSEQTSRNDS